MDGQRFDNLTRALARGSSRRGVIKGLMGGALGGALAVTRRVGLADDTVQICHMTDDPSNPVVLITVSTDAIPAHESHGDVINPDFQNDPANCGGCLVSCDDGDPCTTDTCVAGQCVHTPIVCDDGNPCTDDTCVGGECVFTPVKGRSCDDGNACTENDACDTTGACVGTPVSCDDGNACTTDACDPATGCVHQDVDCDNGDLCTDDSCDPTSGCVYTPIDCSGLDDQCHVGVCNTSTGTCEQQPANEGSSCDDGNACTENTTCDATGACVGTFLNCDDSDSCTSDSCDPDIGCINEPVDCDSHDACIVDTCDAVAGCVHTPLDCDDHNACTADTCDSATGCVHTELVCVSLDACREAAGCDPETGCVFEDVDCSFLDDQCNVGTCSSPLGCGTQPANEGQACTTASDIAGTCASGTCVANHCDNAVLEGNPPPNSLPLCVDDELTVKVNGVQVFQHTGTTACLPPIPLGSVTNGDTIEVIANNSPVTCGNVSLSTIFLVCLDSGSSAVQTLDDVGVPETFDSDAPCSGAVFYDETFTVAI